MYDNVLNKNPLAKLKKIEFVHLVIKMEGSSKDKLEISSLIN